MSLVHADVVELFYTAISGDSQIKGTEGVTVEKALEPKAIATTPAQSNKRIIVTKPRSMPQEWNMGGRASQQKEIIYVITIARTIETNENARDVVNALKRRIQDVLFSAEFLGTGWLQHKEVGDQYLSPPTTRAAYHMLTYEILTSMGVRS
jgi:hypothetical protein